MSSSKTTIDEMGVDIAPYKVGNVNFLIPTASNPDVYKAWNSYYTAILNKTYDANKEKYDKDHKALNFTLQLYPQEVSVVDIMPYVSNIYVSNHVPHQDDILTAIWYQTTHTLYSKHTLDYKDFNVSNSTPVYSGKITNARMEWSGR
ncbi:MAG: hypothetical protein HXO49_07020 [Prevotella sp.]|nr:hypothetical protein [Prevotella sp.]